MTFTNSKKINYQHLTLNRTPNRTHAIDTITIHCFVGQVTAKQGCDYFYNTKEQVSANYVVGYDGSIGMSVEECDRAWTSSNEANDQRAVTIEVACESKAPYQVTELALASLVKLCADICQRNGIKKLLWKNDKSLIGKVDQQNMTVHRWFTSTACPGDFLMGKMGEIADLTNSILNPPISTNAASTGKLYRVQVGAFAKRENAEKLKSELIGKGYSAIIKEE